MLSAEPQAHTEEKNIVSRCSSFLQYAKFIVYPYWKNLQSKVEKYLLYYYDYYNHY